MSTLYLPELLYNEGTFIRDAGVLVGDDGTILSVPAKVDCACDERVELRGRALLPGFVNAHSHAFQRLIRGKAESRVTSGKDFWSWRNTMYHAAAALEPQDVYDVARMAFLEMLLSGTTTVGEFHYLHNAPDGSPYDDPNLLSKQVIAAAQSVGIGIVLLRCAYLRSGFELARDPGQQRFFESLPAYLSNLEELLGACETAAGVRIGVAPHSIRAVPVDDLREISAFARSKHLPLHMHVSEQVAENNASTKEYGVTPVTLLERERVLGADLTAVHAIHISADEIRMLADSGTTICSCPTTERNLGDGVLAADKTFDAGVRIALGSDSQAQIDPLEDARELDYHLRLQHQQRAILDQIHGEALARRLFTSATQHGAQALNVRAGGLVTGNSADFFTIDLRDPAIAGNSAADLLPLIVFSLGRAAIRDVVISGKRVIREHTHALQEEIVGRYQELHQRVWSSGGERRSQR